MKYLPKIKTNYIFIIKKIRYVDLLMGILYFNISVISNAAENAHDDWIQYPPRAAVKLTEQINKFKENNVNLENQKISNDLESINKEVNESETKNSSKSLHEKKTVKNEEITWEKDHKTKNIKTFFDDGSTDIKTVVINPIAGDATYSGNHEMVQMQYADGVKSIITFKAISERVQWGKDHSTKTTLYTFGDGTSNIVIHHVPKEIGVPEYKNGIEFIKITYGDGTQVEEKNEPIETKEKWSKDHLKKIITRIYDDGNSNDEEILVDKTVSIPKYDAGIEKFTITYGDGYQEEQLKKAIDEQVVWSKDHLNKQIKYIFEDKTTNVIEQFVPRTESKPSYKENIETINVVYGDGAKSVITRKAISENIIWSSDHITKKTEFLFSDGTVNIVTTKIEPTVERTSYNKNVKTIIKKFGDNFVDTIVKQAIDENTSWSQDHLYETVTYKFDDETLNTEIQFIPNKELPAEYSSGIETIVKIYGDGTKKTDTYSAVGQNEIWSDDHKSKILIYKFPDGTIHKEQMSINQEIKKNDSKNSSNNAVFNNESISTNNENNSENKKNYLTTLYNSLVKKINNDNLINESNIRKDVNSQVSKIDDNANPVYLQGLKIVTKKNMDGKIETSTFKSISKDVTWSNDRKIQYTTYHFKDGTSNTVATELTNEPRKDAIRMVKPDEENLDTHLLDD